uniref:F-box domain-containing protein n=1 Tax=Kalanchoe fedtschenkoi TaxID=63787 RepID=A0A7N0UUR0_KALFE
MLPTSNHNQKRTAEAMDPMIWSSLPEEILEHILSLLPLRTILGLRSTCKRFNLMLFTPSFVSKHSRPQSPPPLSSFLLLTHPQVSNQFPLYDSGACAWRSLAVSLPNLFPQLLLLQATLVSASNGLLCFTLPSTSSFFVCNPVTKCSKWVQFPADCVSLEMVTLVSNPTGFKIHAISSKSSSSTVFLYNSVASQDWSRFTSFGTSLPENCHQEGVQYNNHLCFVTPEPFRIIKFNLECGKWVRPTAQLPAEDMTFVRLASDHKRGKLYMVGGMGRNGISRSLGLWEMGDDGNWVELERSPGMMCRKFVSVCYHNYEHVYCFWHEGMVCICCYTWPEILYCKISRRSWHWLPKHPSLPDRCSFGFKWFSFVPQLYAPV